MRNAGLTAGAAILLAAAVTAYYAPARSDEDPWSEEALRARYPDPDAGAAKEDFAENAECKDCHEDRIKSLVTSAHRTLANARKSGTHGCQECHGPAAQHVEESGDVQLRNPSNAPDWLSGSPPPPREEKPRETKPGEEKPAEETPAEEKPEAKRGPPVPVTVASMNAVCLRCHLAVLKEPPAEHADHRTWISRAHAPATERSCVSCHRVHVDASQPAFDPAVGPFPTPAAGREAKADYVDPANCKLCHPEFHPQMARSGHAYLRKDGPEHGCGACHGPGSFHTGSGGNWRKITMPSEKLRAKDADSSCNSCHSQRDVTQKWTCSEHARQGVSCVVCHDANAPRGQTLRAPEFQLCGKCHLDVQAKLRLPNRHRVAEGRIACSDCHDPHGNTDKIRDKDLRWRTCATCHAEKAGPFLFDHGIKRTEGCTACHDPHGSSNRRMLTYARIQPMCLQCHPETPHDLRRPRFTNCLDCHTEIHGSDLDRRFLK
jgi:DmsE family decaheme c-type cytochrome